MAQYSQYHLPSNRQLQQPQQNMHNHRNQKHSGLYSQHFSRCNFVLLVGTSFKSSGFTIFQSFIKYAIQERSFSASVKTREHIFSIVLLSSVLFLGLNFFIFFFNFLFLQVNTTCKVRHQQRLHKTWRSK